jgi:hypothetical protein
MYYVVEMDGLASIQWSKSASIGSQLYVVPTTNSIELSFVHSVVEMDGLASIEWLKSASTGLQLYVLLVAYLLQLYGIELSFVHSVVEMEGLASIQWSKSLGTGLQLYVLCRRNGRSCKHTLVQVTEHRLASSCIMS